MKRFFKDTSIEELVKVVADYYLLPSVNLRRRSRKYTKEREIAIYLSKIINSRRNSEVGEHFRISPQAVTTEIENRLANSNELIKGIDEIKCKLQV